MRHVGIKLAVIGALVLFGCAGQIQTTSTYDDSADFAAYRTFAQAPPLRTRPISRSITKIRLAKFKRRSQAICRRRG